MNYTQIYRRQFLADNSQQRHHSQQLHKSQLPTAKGQKLITALFYLVLLVSSLSASAQDYYNVLKYGAKNDSSKLATDAIRKAIDAAYKAGGGTVYFPAGKYLPGPIHLKSNITIYIESCA